MWGRKQRYEKVWFIFISRVSLSDFREFRCIILAKNRFLSGYNHVGGKMFFFYLISYLENNLIKSSIVFIFFYVYLSSVCGQPWVSTTSYPSSCLYYWWGLIVNNEPDHQNDSNKPNHWIWTKNLKLADFFDWT